MKWFEGSIVEAVATSKKKNAIFVVFIEGKDEASKTLHSALDKSDISSHLESDSFVSVMLESGSESHNQFTEIYKLVPVPSVFFIGQNGAPLEIIPGDNSEEIVVGKLKKAITLCNDNSTASPKAPPDNCTKGKTEPSTSQDISNSSEVLSPPTISGVIQEASSPDLPNSPVEKIKMNKDEITQLIEKKREERKMQDEREENEREMERRKMGQAAMEAKRKQQERELQDLRNERMKEKQEEKLAKQRVLEQIAQDRAERAACIAATQASTSTQPPIATEQPRASSPNVDMSTTRLQFKMPDGQTRTHTFPAETTLGQVRKFIDNNIVLPFREYQMATTFPRREFTFRDIDTSLIDLELLPSAVILIMPLQGNMSLSRGGGWSRMIVEMFWNMMQPFFSLSNYIQNLVWGRRGGDSTGNPSAGAQTPPSQPPPSRSVVRKRGNIHSLADNENSGDENNTWNGNSTQQM